MRNRPNRPAFPASRFLPLRAAHAACVVLVLVAANAGAGERPAGSSAWSGIGLAAAAGVGATVMDPTAVRGGGTGLRITPAGLMVRSAGSGTSASGLGLKAASRRGDSPPPRAMRLKYGGN